MVKVFLCFVFNHIYTNDTYANLKKIIELISFPEMMPTLIPFRKKEDMVSVIYLLFLLSVED